MSVFLHRYNYFIPFFGVLQERPGPKPEKTYRPGPKPEKTPLPAGPRGVTIAVADNDNGRFAEGWRIKWQAAVSAAKHIVEEFDIKQGSIYQPVKMMSGGNIQKLLLGREIAAKPQLMVVLYPVRGLDIGAIEAVHKLLLKLKEENTAILLVSEELEELAALADRVGVMFAGKLMGEFAVQDMDIEKIGALMAGVTDNGGEGK